MNKKYLLPVSSNIEATEIQRSVARNCSWKEVSIVSYNLPLMSKLSVCENIMLPINYFNKMKRKDAEPIVYELLEKFGLEHTLHYRQKILNDYEILVIKFLRAIMQFPKHIVFIMPNNMLPSEDYLTFIAFADSIIDFNITVVEHENFGNYYIDTDYMEIKKEEWLTHVLGI